MGNKFITFIIFTILMASLVSANQIVLQARPLDGSNNPVPNSYYTFVFNWTTGSNCSGVIFTNSTNGTTDITGSLNLTVTIPDSITTIPSYLCEYRNGSIRATHTLSSQILGAIYSSTINTSSNIYSGGNITTSNYGFFGWVGSAVNRITGGFFTNLDVSNNINSSNLTTFNVLVNGTNIDSTYLKIINWNSTNTSYRTLSNLTFYSGNMSFNGNQLFIDNVSGRVGIGTASPAQSLDINGSVNIASTGGLRFGNIAGRGVFAVEGYGIDVMGLTNAIVHIDSDNDLTTNYFAVVNNQNTPNDNTNELFRVQENGNVGINTTTPNATLNIFNSLGNASFLINNATNSHLFVNGTTGSVGIGTTSPSTALDVNGNTTLQGTLKIGSNIIVNDTIKGDAVHALGIYNDGTRTSPKRWRLNLYGYKTNDSDYSAVVIDVNYGAGIANFNFDKAGADSSAMDILINSWRFTSGGGFRPNVDDNTAFANPGYKVNSVWVGTGAVYVIPDTFYYSEAPSGVVLGVNRSFILYNSRSAEGTSSNYERLRINTTSNVYTFASEALGTGVARNFAFTGANVGIGTTAPQNTLNVFGDANATTTAWSYGLNLTSGYLYATNTSGGLGWIANYSTYLLKPTWAQATNGTLLAVLNTINSWTANQTLNNNYITNGTGGDYIYNNGTGWCIGAC